MIISALGILQKKDEICQEAGRICNESISESDRNEMMLFNGRVAPGEGMRK